jgi:WD40 repeat protein
LRIARSQPVTTTQLSADGTQLATQGAAGLTLWRLPAKPVTPRPATVDALPTALALDGANGTVAVGLASGQLQVVPAGGARAPLSFFGHRGAITAAALNADRGLAATGGTDGVVRLWDVATGAPTGAVAQPADAAVTALALSEDGRYVASAAGGVARVARVADGSVALEVATGAAVTTLALAADGAVLAAGDDAGSVTIARLGQSSRATAQLGAAATSLAFVPGEDRLAAADAGGGVTLVAADGEVEGSARRWTQPVRWLQFDPAGDALLAATDAWAHALSATADLSPVHSKLVVWPAASTALAAVSATTVRFAGVEAGGVLASGAVDLSAAPAPAPADAAAFVTRDWSAIFGLRLNDNGEPVPDAL